MRSFSRFSLGWVTAAAMTVATFPIIAFSVLAADLIEEFDVSRAQVGFLVTATGIVGAALSPVFGSVTDRIGSVNAARSVLAIGVITLAGLAVAPSYGALVLAALATGVPNGWSNPATNALIVDNLPVGERGMVTGIKQSGVQIGTFLGGLLLPLFTGWWDWRFAIAAFIVIPVAGLIGTIDRPETGERHATTSEGRAPIPISVKWVAAYGTISGFCTSAMFGFLPLFAEEDQLWSPGAAGALVAVVGAFGIGARIVWPSLAERRIGHGRTLRLLAAITLISALLLGLAALSVVPSWALVPAALLLGAGAIAWNAVGMLAVMDFSPRRIVGKSTGLVLAGFLTGIATGAPVMGWSVDTLGSYAPGFLVIAGLLGVDAIIGLRIPESGNVAVS